MTKQLIEWPFGRNAIGFDNLLDNLQYTAQMGATYPPYNIVRESETKHRVEIALAGFSRDDIEIVHEKNILTIKGEVKSEESDGDAEGYIHKGISSKAFERSFTLGEYIEVTNAAMKNGLLIITCETLVPEEMQPKKIDIS